MYLNSLMGPRKRSRNATHTIFLNWELAVLWGSSQSFCLLYMHFAFTDRAFRFFPHVVHLFPGAIYFIPDASYFLPYALCESRHDQIMARMMCAARGLADCIIQLTFCCHNILLLIFKSWLLHFCILVSPAFILENPIFKEFNF